VETFKHCFETFPSARDWSKLALQTFGHSGQQGHRQRTYPRDSCLISGLAVLGMPSCSPELVVHDQSPRSVHCGSCASGSGIRTTVSTFIEHRSILWSMSTP
jgi:hypothetical protein